MEKYYKLIENLKQYGKLCIGYSGGADSTLLIHAAKEALSDNMFAVVANTDFFAEADINFAVKTAKDLGVQCYVVDVDVLSIPQITYNEANRCYHCKYVIFSSITKIAYLYGTKSIADGKIVEDTQEYRPGLTAIEELGIISPLYECGINKSDVRAISKELGLPTWNLPTNSCLATRFPYETELTVEKLANVEKGELYIRSLGVGVIRLRTHDDIARIEVCKEDYDKIIDSKELVDYLKELGYNYVTLDLSAFKSGSMDVKREGYV